ncbi:MAG TPA: tetratricopeptide repeat protein [Gemmatimonadaceae bacterium]
MRHTAVRRGARGSAARRAALLIALSLAAPAAAAAQAPVTDTIAEARRLDDSRSFGAAEALLRSYLRNHPDNGDAASLLAHTLYWLRRPAEARVVYEAALLRHPEDITLRLDYGRMLMDTNDRDRARELLAPMSGSRESRGRAEALLGTLYYWGGDYTTAVRLFRDALRADSSQREARRQLAEILTLTAPWARIATALRHDDQTLDRIGGDVQAGWYATPLLALSARVRPMQFRLGDTVTRTLTLAELGFSDFAPSARLETEMSAGMLQRSYGSSSDWVGRLVLGFRLPQQLTLRVRAEREPYLYTLASLSTPVMTQTLATTLDLNGPRGWLGQAAAQSERYPDANSVTTGYAWLLAPLLYGPSGELQVGYSVSAQNASQSRFELAQTSQPFAPGDPRYSTLGVYAPYYTPSNLFAQSVLAAFALRSSSGTEFRASGAFGVRATDDAPGFQVVSVASPPSTTVERTFQRRVFTPWNVRGSLAATLSEGWRLDIAGEYAHTAFYTAVTTSVQLTYRFVAAAKRRAERY